MSSLKYRLLLIGALLATSVGFLFPRDVTVRRRGADGVLQETVERKVPLKRGLDLQGGMHLVLEVDDTKQAIAEKDKADAIDRALKTVRTRVEGYGVSEPVVVKSGDARIVVELPGISDQERATAVVREQAFLEFKITDKTQALERSLPRLDAIVRDRRLTTSAPVSSPTAQAPDVRRDAPRGLQGILSDTGKTATKTDTTKKDSVVAGGGAFSNLIQQGTIAGEYFVKIADVPMMDRFLADSVVRSALPPAKSIMWGSDSVSIANAWYRSLYVTDARAIITGDFLTDARPNTSPLEGTIVQFTLNNVGGRRFRNETGKHIGDNMAIVLDNRVIGRPPVIQSAIGTQGQITMGGKDLSAAQDLALVLRAGALPVPLRVAEVRTIGPSLGQDSIQKGIYASVLAVILVVGIMIGYYKFSGALSIGALFLYVIFTLAILSLFGAAITLPGIAGFVLSIGIAVDANVLIFERIREELARGKTVRASIDEGFRHAMPAIVDSNVSTILTAAVLYQWGTGSVKGFAVTLIAGVVASMFTAIFVVKTFYLVWLQRARSPQTLSI
jgi:preprotein translocase subunit SecD